MSISHLVLSAAVLLGVSSAGACSENGGGLAKLSDNELAFCSNRYALASALLTSDVENPAAEALLASQMQAAAITHDEIATTKERLRAASVERFKVDLDAPGGPGWLQAFSPAPDVQSAVDEGVRKLRAAVAQANAIYGEAQLETVIGDLQTCKTIMGAANNG